MTRMTYVNRKSDGVKLGQIVAKDLRKRLRFASKPESQRVAPHVQLELEGKDLTDDGVQALVEGLCDATLPAEGIITTRLQSWNLSGNRLTAKCLPFLTQAMNAALDDIEDLDLSNNAIEVIEKADLTNWEGFLMAVGRCKVLHRLVLTDNAIGSGPAMEVLARVAVYRKPKKTSHGPEQSQALQERDSNKRISHVIHTGKTPHPTITSQCLLSIRHLSIDNTCLTDEGALFLSYVLIRHDWVHNGPPSTTRASDSTTEHEPSIVCLPNDKLSNVGARLLKLAQSINEDELVGSKPIKSSLVHDMLSRYDSTGLGLSGAKKISHSGHSTSQSSNDTPGRYTGSSQVYGSAVEELESLRKKIQRGIIENCGLNAVELWNVALKLLSYTRGVMIESINFPTLSSREGRSFSAQLPMRARAEIMPDPAWPSLPLARPRSQSRSITPSSGVTKLNGSANGDTDHQNRSIRSRSLTHRDPSDRRSHSSVATRRDAPNDTNSDRQTNIGPFPAHVWELILSNLSDPERLLSKKQKRSIIEWGKSRSTLAAEMGSVGKLDSVQTWRVLDAMGCLFYDLRN